jgi:hypothetical protein
MSAIRKTRIAGKREGVTDAPVFNRGISFHIANYLKEVRND